MAYHKNEIFDKFKCENRKEKLKWVIFVINTISMTIEKVRDQPVFTQNNKIVSTNYNILFLHNFLNIVRSLITLQ